MIVFFLLIAGEKQRDLLAYDSGGMFFPKPELLPYAENIMEAAGQLFVDENLKNFKTNFIN
jgi:hypothetical protein